MANNGSVSGITRCICVYIIASFLISFGVFNLHYFKIINYDFLPFKPMNKYPEKNYGKVLRSESWGIIKLQSLIFFSIIFHIFNARLVSDTLAGFGPENHPPSFDTLAALADSDFINIDKYISLFFIIIQFVLYVFLHINKNWWVYLLFSGYLVLSTVISFFIF